jgi:hypothetical protein
MKTMQTWGWLAAGVLAAGLNASYHDGGQAWVHRVADRVEAASNVMRDRAAGRADLFLTEARLFLAGSDDSSSRLAEVFARIQTKLDRSETQVARGQAMSDREQAAHDRAEAEHDRLEAQRQRTAGEMEANRERIEAQIAANRARVEVRMARLRTLPSFTAVVFPPQPPVCPRVRVSMPRMPRIDMPRINISAPTVRIEAPLVDPI